MGEKTLEYNSKENTVHIFIDLYSISLLEFCILIDNFFRKHNLPYRIKKKEIKTKKYNQGLGEFL